MLQTSNRVFDGFILSCKTKSLNHGGSNVWVLTAGHGSILNTLYHFDGSKTEARQNGSKAEWKQGKTEAKLFDSQTSFQHSVFIEFLKLGDLIEYQISSPIFTEIPD
jgi:hypothetical protein